MAVYFYHFRTPQGSLLKDEIGSHLPTDEAAVLEAAMSVADLMRNFSSPTLGGAFEVHDEGGWLVERIPVWRH